MTQEEIREVCDMHGIEPIDAELINTDYVISRSGDLICGKNWSYCIWDSMLLNTEWLEHLQEKNWYSVRTFFPAYIEALCRQRKERVFVSIGDRRVILEPFKLRYDVVQMQNYIAFLDLSNKMRDIINSIKQ